MFVILWLGRDSLSNLTSKEFKRYVKQGHESRSCLWMLIVFVHVRTR